MAKAIESATQQSPAQVVFLLDASGSMGEYESAVVNAYNAFIDSVRGNVGLVQVTLGIFTKTLRTVYESAPIETVPPLTVGGGPKQYRATGGNHILLSIMAMAAQIEKKHGLHTPVAFVVQTDGGEAVGQGHGWVLNPADYPKGDNYWKPVADLVKRNAAYGWTFTLIYTGNRKEGENIGRRMGLDRDHILIHDGSTAAFTDAAELADKALVARPAPAGPLPPAFAVKSADILRAYPYIRQFGLA